MDFGTEVESPPTHLFEPHAHGMSRVKWFQTKRLFIKKHTMFGSVETSVLHQTTRFIIAKWPCFGIKFQRQNCNPLHEVCAHLQVDIVFFKHLYIWGHKSTLKTYSTTITLGTLTIRYLRKRTRTHALWKFITHVLKFINHILISFSWPWIRPIYTC